MNPNVNGDIIQALQCLLTGHNNDIQQAESFFDNARQNSSLLQELLKVIMTDFPPDIKICAANIIAKELKNALNKENIGFDLNSLKENIASLITLYLDMKPLRKKLEEVLKYLVDLQFPNYWPNLIDHVLSNMKAATETKELYGSLRVIYSIFGAIKHYSKEKREPLILMHHKIFPYFENLALNGIKKNEPDFLIILHMLVKIFSVSNSLELNQYFNEQSLKIWLIILKRGWEYKDEQPNNPVMEWDDMCDVDSQLISKLNRNSLEAISRLTQIFAKNTNHTKSLENTLFAAVRALMDSCLKYLGLVVQGNETQKPIFHSSYCVYTAYKFLFYSLQLNRNLGQFIDDSTIDIIFYDLAIYDLQISIFEHQLYTENVQQYIMSEEDERNEPVMRVKRAVADFFSLLCKYDEGFIANYMAFLEKAVQESVNIKNPQMIVNARFKEGLLYGFENIIEYLPKSFINNPDYLLRNILLPCLNEKEDLLTARACSIIARLEDAEITSEETAFKLCQSVCKTISSDSLYLKVKGLGALGMIVRYEMCQSLLKKDVSYIINNIFEIMKQVSTEDVIENLKSIIINFYEDIAPFAQELLENILTTFWEVLNEVDFKNSDDEEFWIRGDAYRILGSCLVTISQILLADLNSQIYIDSKVWLLDIVKAVFCNKALDGLLDQTLDLFNIYLFKLNSFDQTILDMFMVINYTILGIPQNNPESWSITEKTFINEGLMEQQINCLPLDRYLGIYGNYVQKAGDRLMPMKTADGINYLRYYFDVIDKLGEFGSNENSDYELIGSLRMVCYWVENQHQLLKDKYSFMLLEISKYLSGFLNMNRKNLLSVVLQKICFFLYIDASYYLQIWKSQNVYEPFLFALFGNLDLFVNATDKNVFLMGVIGILNLKPEEFPQILPIDSLMKETFNAAIYITQADDLNTNKLDDESKVTGGMDTESDEDDDETWNEEDYMEEVGDIDYSDPFEKVEPILELKDTLEKMEIVNEKYFLEVIEALPKHQNPNLKDCFDYFEKKKKNK